MRKQYEGMFTIDRLYVLMASEVNEKCGHSKLAIRFICLLMGKRNLILPYFYFGLPIKVKNWSEFDIH